MDDETVQVTMDIPAADLAELTEWARSEERSVADLLHDALQQYLSYGRADIADLEERMKGPFYPLQEVRARLAERRRQLRADAAE